MYIVSFSFHNQHFKLYYKVCNMFPFLLESLNLLFSIYCLTLITEHYLDFFNKIVPILDVVYYYNSVTFEE